MTPTDLLLNADFRSLAPGVYSYTAMEDAFGLRKTFGGYTINRLGTESWSHTFTGYVQQSESRVGVLDTSAADPGVAPIGLVVEGTAKNYLEDIDWTAQPVTNGTIAWGEGPTFCALAPARGFVLESTGVGPCYVELPGLIAGIESSIIYNSVAALAISNGNAFIGFSVDGTIQNIAPSVGAWRWFASPDITGPAPANFRVGFVAGGAGEKVAFAFPQVELYDGTSAILGGVRPGDTYTVALETILDAGRLNFEWDLLPESNFPGSTATVQLFEVDATNHVRLVWDPAALPLPAYRMEVTINGVVVTSDPFGWNRGTRLRFFLSCGNGPAKLAWQYGDAPAECLSTHFSAVQGAWPTPRNCAPMGTATGRQLSSTVYALRAYHNGDRPDWVGCVCGS